MRQITKKSALALLGYNPTFTEGNTTVANVGKKLGGSGRGMFLHGNLIAYRSYSEINDEFQVSVPPPGKGTTSLTLAGWNTRTTRDRLNGILELMDKPWRFTQREYDAYFLDTNNGTGFKISPWAQIDARTGQIISDQ